LSVSGSFCEYEVTLPPSSEAVLRYECFPKYEDGDDDVGKKDKKNDHEDEAEEEGEVKFSYPLSGLVLGMKALGVAKVKNDIKMMSR